VRDITPGPGRQQRTAGVTRGGVMQGTIQQLGGGARGGVQAAGRSVGAGAMLMRVSLVSLAGSVQHIMHGHDTQKETPSLHHHVSHDNTAVMPACVMPVRAFHCSA
jgi:hypothetical protein